MSVSLYCGSCLDVMAEKIEAATIDLVCCDMPYGTTQNSWDVVIPLDLLWLQYRRILKPGGAIVLTGQGLFTARLIMSNPKWYRYSLVWRKNKPRGFLNAKRCPLRSHEDIVIFAPKSTVYNPQKTTGHNPVNAFTRTGYGTCYGSGEAGMSGGGSTERYPQSVLDFPVVNNEDPNKTHPTQKPVELMEWIIKTYSNGGDVVLDHCMGSGSTGVAAVQAGRQFIGIEKDADHFESASRWIGAQGAK